MSKQKNPSNPSKQTLGAGICDIGCKRKNNEDRIYINNRDKLYIVADGMGGHKAGEIAAQIATSILPKRILKHKRFLQKSNIIQLQTYLQKQVYGTSTIVNQRGSQQIQFNGMGATLVLAYFANNWAHFVHMGDSRAYLYRTTRLTRITEDHSFVNMLIRKGKISQDQAFDHPAKNIITQFIGMDTKTRPDVSSIKLKSGDRIMLCSDGLSDMIPDHDIEKLFVPKKTGKQTCKMLVQAAKSAGGLDNITVAVIDI